MWRRKENYKISALALRQGMSRERLRERENEGVMEREIRGDVETSASGRHMARWGERKRGNDLVINRATLLSDGGQLMYSVPLPLLYLLLLLLFPYRSSQLHA